MSEITNVTTQADFTSLTASLPSTTLLAISFHTPWAGAPCTQMAAIISALAATYPPTIPPTITFLSLDAEALPDISESYYVSAVPFLVLQRDGKVLESVSGCDAAKVRAAVERHVAKPGREGEKLKLPEALHVTERMQEHVTPSNNRTTSGIDGATSDLSKYAPGPNDPPTAPVLSSMAQQKEELDKRLAELVKAAPVMLFMKGTPSAPQCGFSRQLVSILREQGVRYGFFNILADEEVRQGLKIWADWPTFPQLWCGGELVGGLDIVSCAFPLRSLDWLTGFGGEVKEELESDPEYFKEYAAAKGKGGMAAPEAQTRPQDPEG